MVDQADKLVLSVVTNPITLLQLRQLYDEYAQRHNTDESTRAEKIPFSLYRILRVVSSILYQLLKQYSGSNNVNSSDNQSTSEALLEALHRTARQARYLEQYLILENSQMEEDYIDGNEDASATDSSLIPMQVVPCRDKNLWQWSRLTAKKEVLDDILTMSREELRTEEEILFAMADTPIPQPAMAESHSSIEARKRKRSNDLARKIKSEWNRLRKWEEDTETL